MNITKEHHLEQLNLMGANMKNHWDTEVGELQAKIDALKASIPQVKHDAIMEAADSEAESIPEHDRYKAFAASQISLTQELDA